MASVPETYTVAEAARLLKVQERTVRAWLRSGKIRGFKIGPKSLRITESELQRFFRACEAGRHA